MGPNLRADCRMSSVSVCEWDRTCDQAPGNPVSPSSGSATVTESHGPLSAGLAALGLKLPEVKCTWKSVGLTASVQAAGTRARPMSPGRRIPRSGENPHLGVRGPSWSRGGHPSPFAHRAQARRAEGAARDFQPLPPRPRWLQAWAQHATGGDRASPRSSGHRRRGYGKV